jgi:hypothetical protein
MDGSRFDSRPGVRSNEIMFPGKSPRNTCFQLLVLSLTAALVACAFAGSQEFRDWLRVETSAAPWAASFCGGAATILFVCAAWMWSTRLQWVAVSPDGIRWLRGPRARHRKWDQYLGLYRGSIEMTVWGEDLKTGRYADIEFRKGRPLRVGTNTILGYEDLIAEIQMTSAEAMRSLFPLGGSRSGETTPSVLIYGPLRLHSDWIEWDGTCHPWDEIEEYEVAVGYLRIRPTEGTEFVRRLCELGDWDQAVAHLDANVGHRRTGQGAAESTTASGQSPAPEGVPSPC